jgi:hypothetical protein
MLMAISLFGCSSTEVQTESVEVPEALPALQGEALLALEAADAADGATDKLVGKCVTCKLHMDGKTEHSVSVGEYQMNFCTDNCLKSFIKDPVKALLALQ